MARQTDRERKRLRYNDREDDVDSGGGSNGKERRVEIYGSVTVKGKRKTSPRFVEAYTVVMQIKNHRHDRDNLSQKCLHKCCK